MNFFEKKKKAYLYISYSILKKNIKFSFSQIFKYFLISFSKIKKNKFNKIFLFS
jgi:hypothetical protein